MNRLRSTLVSAATAAVLLAALSGCAPRIAPGLVLNSPREAWTAFRQHYRVPPKAPAMRARASLYYSRVKPMRRTNRTLVSLWGDFNGPMRLDVSASIGKLLAHIREADDGLLVFYPAEDKAYVHSNAVLGATRLGMPFPFSLSQLARVVAGDFSGLTPRAYAEADRKGDHFAFTFKRGLTERVELDEYGRPVLLEGRAAKGPDAPSWTLEINRYEDAEQDKAPLPGMLTLTMDNGEQGVLHIKSRELMLAPWPAASTDLALPDGIEPIRLDNGYPKTTGEIPTIYEDK